MSNVFVSLHKSCLFSVLNEGRQFDFTINDEPAGRVVFKLSFDDVVPKTARNFRELATDRPERVRLQASIV